MKKKNIIQLSVLTLLTLVAYIPTFVWMYQRWSTTDTYYSHGILVPFISIFIIWLKREQLFKAEAEPNKLGWALFIIGILTHAFCVLARINSASGFTLLLVIVGLVLIFLGSKILKMLSFPISFIAFMIPLPEVVIANLSFRLKLFAAQISTFLMNNMGVAAIREGSVIKTKHAYLVVEDPCSGIRSLIALIALGALMAYFSNLSKPKKLIVFLSAIPIAVFSNVIRITALGMVSEIYGSKYATGLFHDTMGVLVFVFAFLGLSLIAKLLE